VKHQLLTAVIASAFVVLALAAGSHRKGALIGAGISGITAILSILLVGRSARGAKPVQRALAVMTLTFLLRIVLVAVGTIAVARAGESIVGFVAAFFVPYFVFAGVEASYIHSLRHQGSGPTA
jgi:hypothetical protein